MKNIKLFKAVKVKENYTGACCVSCTNRDIVRNGIREIVCCGNTGEVMKHDSLCSDYVCDMTVYKMTPVEQKLFFNSMGKSMGIENKTGQVNVIAYGFLK